MGYEKKIMSCLNLITPEFLSKRWTGNKPEDTIKMVLYWPDQGKQAHMKYKQNK